MSDPSLHWVAAVAIVNFDLELGQSIEHIEPASFSLTEQERLNICYLAFPDSNSGERPSSMSGPSDCKRAVQCSPGSVSAVRHALP